LLTGILAVETREGAGPLLMLKETFMASLANRCAHLSTSRADVIGAYEFSEGSKTLRLEFKADGIVHSYMNGIFADARLATWALNEGEVRMINQYGQCLVYRVEPDGSLTAIRSEFVKPNGEKWSKDFPASEQKNLLKK